MPLHQRVYRSIPKEMHIQIGEYGERVAASFLKEKGCQILTRNYKAQWGDKKSQQGEIDLICRQGKTIVFVEVKTRDAQTSVRGIKAVNQYKKQKMIYSAYQYIRELVEVPPHARFDIVEVYLEEMQPPRCELTISAFTMDTILKQRRK